MLCVLSAAQLGLILANLGLYLLVLRAGNGIFYAKCSLIKSPLYVARGPNAVASCEAIPAAKNTRRTPNFMYSA